MPVGVRFRDEEALRDEIRKNPKSTRWVTKRGIVRKKQKSGKEKRETVNEDYVRPTLARERYAEEIDGREMHERDSRAPETHAPEIPGREMGGLQMQSHERESSDIGMGDRHGFNRRRDEGPSHMDEPGRFSDPYENRVKKKEEYDLDHQPRHDARPSHGSIQIDNDEGDPEVYSAPFRRSHSPIPSNSPYMNQRANSTRVVAPRQAAIPSIYHPEDLRPRNSPSRGHQIPRAQPHTRPEAPQQEQLPPRNAWAPPTVEDVADDDYPMPGAWRRDWSPHKAVNSRPGRTWEEPPPLREEWAPPAAEAHVNTSRRARRDWDGNPPWREEWAPHTAEETAAKIDSWIENRGSRYVRVVRRKLDI